MATTNAKVPLFPLGSAVVVVASKWPTLSQNKRECVGPLAPL